MSNSKSILFVSGPMLGTLGKRDPDVYGTDTLQDIEGFVRQEAEKSGYELVCFQSDVEGEIVKVLQSKGQTSAGVIINPGAYSHYSIAIRDAIDFLSCPVVEVHLSNIYAREKFRHKSVVAQVCDGQITGLGKHGYIGALKYIIEKNK